MFESTSPFCPFANAIFVPSGDQPGLKHPSAVGSANGPPQAVVGWTFTWRSPEPSAWTVQSELWSSGVTRREKTMSLPCGDQSSAIPALALGGKIRFSPVPLTLTTNRPSSSLGPNRWNTIRCPSDDQPPGTSSPPGIEVIRRSPPPSDARTVRTPFWLPSSLKNSQRSSSPSGDGVPQPLKVFGSCWPTSRN